MVLAALSLGMNGLCAQENVEQTNWPRTAAQVTLGGLCIVAAAYGAMNTDAAYVAQLCPDDAKKEMIRCAGLGTIGSLLSMLSFYVTFNDEDCCDDNDLDRAGALLLCPLGAALGGSGIAIAYHIFNQK